MTVEPLRAGDPPAIGAYELLGRLGAGGMGQVFLGRARDGRMAAVKVVRADLAEQSHFRQRFRAEVRAAQRVDGVWTAPVLDCDTESAVPWVATAYVAGAPLQKVVDDLHGPLAEHSVWALAHGLVRALTQIHAVDLIHRDLKPSNVMVSAEGPRVIDFGIARAVDANSHLTRTGAVLGTPGYMAPEQVSGDRLTGAVDVFALGAVLAFAATGLPPFSWDGAGVHTVLYRVMHMPPRLGPEDGPLRGALRALVLRCLAKEPGERPHLTEIQELAEEGTRTAAWLPPALTARLEQDAAVLLAYDGPVRADPAAGPPADWPGGEHPVDGTPPAVAPDQTTYVSGEVDVPGAPSGLPESLRTPKSPQDALRPRRPRTIWTTWSGRRRNGYVLGAVAAVMALVVGGWLLTDGSGEAGRSRAGGEGTADPVPMSLPRLVPDDVHDAGGLTVHVANHDGVALNDEGEGPPVGFEADLVKEMADRLDVAVRWVEHEHHDDSVRAVVEPDRRAGAHIALGDLPDTPKNRRSWGVHMVDDLRSGYGIVDDGKVVPFDSLSGALCDKTITTYTDTNLQEEIRRAADCPRPLRFLPFDSRDDMAPAILEGRADVAVLQYPLAAEMVYDRPHSGLTVKLVDDARGYRGIAVPRNQPKLRRAVVEALRAVMEDGTYRQLLKRWHLLDGAVDFVRVDAGH